MKWMALIFFSPQDVCVLQWNFRSPQATWPDFRNHLAACFPQLPCLWNDGIKSDSLEKPLWLWCFVSGVLSWHECLIAPGIWIETGLLQSVIAQRNWVAPTMLQCLDALELHWVSWWIAYTLKSRSSKDHCILVYIMVFFCMGNPGQPSAVWISNPAEISIPFLPCLPSPPTPPLEDSSLVISKSLVQTCIIALPVNHLLHLQLRNFIFPAPAEPGIQDVNLYWLTEQWEIGQSREILAHKALRLCL